jgi:Na+-driven multidrug efflux pump
MTLSNISNPLMGMADTAMLGHLPDGIYLGAVAIGANIMALLFWMLAFLRMGTTSFVGRHYGSGDDDALLKHLGRSIGVALTMGLSLIALQWVLINLAVLLIAPNAELSQLAHQYCTIRIYGAPAVLLTYIAIGTLIGLQNTRLPLLIAVASNALNIGLDYLFIVRFNWLSAGAAYATLIAEYSACALAIYLCIRLLRRKLQQLSWQQLTNGLVDWPQWRKLLSLNSDLFIRTGALLFVFNFLPLKAAASVKRC